jgi:endonuclease/exonuclease/phosphatase family metal-dependent hydrolase
LRNFFKRFVFSFNIIAIILLGGAYLSAYISPNEAWMFALLGLAYPFLLLINIFFALFWLAQFKWYAVFSIGIMLLGIGFFNSSFQFRKRRITSENAIVISSYNVGLFGYFQSKWYTGEMVEVINKNSTDILCIQEFLNLKTDKGNTVDSIKAACGFKYSYFQKLADGRKKGEYGMAIFSKFPIEHKALVHFDGLTGNMCMYADIRIDTGLYRLYNVHLQSFKFKKQDYQFIKDMPEDNDEKIKRSKGLLNRMKNAYIKRAEQVEEIRKSIKETEIPYFMIGDFNDPPMSYSYNTLRKGLKDAFVENGSGMGKTYIGIMPNFRIDYILFPQNFTGLHYETIKLSSDHSLVSAGLKLKNE